ncbi:MAG TPA: SWIM zinc finger family protein [Actinomycetes bacterium]|jgi:uncharacterized Zn finger protein|nr:SWIM zinc finger family protein [Actinomycetes bacterium]
MAGSWDEWPPPSRPRRVEGGIKARSRRGQIGETWWSRRFIAILEALGMGPRLQRGRAYARAGQVLDLAVTPGTVSARVQGSRARPYRVRVALPRLPEADWALVESTLAARALYSAKLLAGELPHRIEEVFASCGLSLFPSNTSELGMSCSCPDWAVPCKHIAATFYLLAEAFDRDPFLVLAWRGRERDDLLARLRGLRALTAPEADVSSSTHAGSQDRRAIEDLPLAEQLDRFWSPGGDLTASRRRGATAAAAPDLLLLGLEPLDVQLGGRRLEKLLVPAYHAMTQARMRIVGAIGDAAPSLDER